MVAVVRYGPSSPSVSTRNAPLVAASPRVPLVQSTRLQSTTSPIEAMGIEASGIDASGVPVSEMEASGMTRQRR